MIAKRSVGGDEYACAYMVFVLTQMRLELAISLCGIHSMPRLLHAFIEVCYFLSGVDLRLILVGVIKVIVNMYGNMRGRWYLACMSV